MTLDGIQITLSYVAKWINRSHLVESHKILSLHPTENNFSDILGQNHFCPKQNISFPSKNDFCPGRNFLYKLKKYIFAFEMDGKRLFSHGQNFSTAKK